LDYAETLKESIDAVGGAVCYYGRKNKTKKRVDTLLFDFQKIIL
jgi:hypothetical protein